MEVKKMKNITHEQMKLFCKSCNCKIYIFEPIDIDESEYRLVVNTGVSGKMPEFSVTKNHFKGIGEHKQINLTEKWLKFQQEIKTAFEESNLSL